MFRFKIIFLFSFFVLLQSCISNKKIGYLQDKTQDQPQQYDQTKSFSANEVEYRLEKEDILFIEILYQSLGNEQDLNKSTIGERESRVAFSQHPYTSGFQINSLGNVSIENLGQINVLGKSIDEVRTLISDKAESYYLNPTVKVYLMNAFVTVLGDVNNPGRFQFFDKMNLLEATGLAGDLGEFADRESIKILRPGNNTYSIYHVDLTDELVINSSNFSVLPGDVIMVKPQTRKKFAGRNIQWALSGVSIVITVITLLTR